VTEGTDFAQWEAELTGLVEAARQPVTYFMLIDVSSSMTGALEMLGETRIDFSHRTLRDYLAGRTERPEAPLFIASALGNRDISSGDSVARGFRPAECVSPSRDQCLDSFYEDLDADRLLETLAAGADCWAFIGLVETLAFLSYCLARACKGSRIGISVEPAEPPGRLVTSARRPPRGPNRGQDPTVLASCGASSY
jgi:hypothetical protein